MVPVRSYVERRVDAPANLAVEHLSNFRCVGEVGVRCVLRAFLVSAAVAQINSASAHICKRVDANCSGVRQ